MSDGIVLELGDVINIYFKDEPQSNDPFLINYIDEDRIDLMNLETEDILILPLSNKRIQEYEVEKITLLTRNPLKGYALQHGLTAGKNVVIGFVGVTDTLVGEILETRNDIITILVNDTLEILYIDFGFKGIPNEVPIRYIEAIKQSKKNEVKEASIDKIYEYLEKQLASSEEQQVSINKLTEQIIIEVDGFDENQRPWISTVVRRYVDKLNAEEMEKELRESTTEGEAEDEAESEYKSKTGESQSEPEEPVIGMTPQTRSRLQYEVTEADRIMREELFYNQETPKQQLVDELFEDEEDPNQPFYKFARFYTLEEQTKDMLDDYLARIPTEQRTPAVLNKIHNIIQRYTQLRSIYIITPPIQYPLYDSVKHFSKSIGWLMPVVAQSLFRDDEEGPNNFRDDDTSPDNFNVFLQALKNTTDQYNSDVDNRYEDYLLKIDNVFSSIYNRNPNGTADCVVEGPVGTDLTVVSKLEETPYITKYLSTPQYSEALCLLSILTLPYAATRYSRVYGHMASIYETSNIMQKTQGLSLFKILKPSSAINNVYVGGEADSPDVVDKTEINNYSLVGEKNFDTLLHSVLEKELDINNYLKSLPYSTKGFGFSVYKLCRQLEPFQIYYDRLKTSQKLLLEEMTKNRIKKYKRNLKKNTSAFESLYVEITKASKINSPPNHWKDILHSVEKNMDQLKSVYNESFIIDNFDTLTPTELVLLTTKIDCGEYYNFSLSADKLSHELEQGRNSKNNKFPLIKFVSATNTPAGMPFKYEEVSPQTISQPQEPRDGTAPFLLEIFEIIKQNRIANAKKPQIQIVPNTTSAPVVQPPPAFPQMNPEVVQPETITPTMNDITGEGLNIGRGTGEETVDEVALPPHYAKVTVLPVGKGGKEYCKNIEVVKIYIDVTDIHRDNDVDIQSTNLPTPRQVVDGDYALLLDSSISVSYYIRTNNKWREDVNVKTNTIYDTPSMFCNMGLWCVRDFTSKKCVPMQELTNYMVQNVISQMPSDKVNDSFIEYIKKNFVQQTERSIEIGAFNFKFWAKNDTVKLNLGLTRDHIDVVSSPYLDLFLSIMAEKNFRKRQQDIINFCMEYTRNNNSSNNLETPYWRYCVETGVQLVPTSLYTIASLYNTHTHNVSKFQEQLELVKKDIGVLSEDGAYVIDKYTGFKISEIVFDYSEDYDDAGFVVKTRDVITDVEKEDKELSMKRELMSTQESKYIRYIIGFISEKMSINLQKQVEFIVRCVMNTLISNKPSKAMKDTHLVFLTLGMIVIAIQTSIPSVVSKRTFPNCKERFIGYPLTGNEADMEAIEYVACVISHAKQPGPPWNVLLKFKVDGMKDLIKKMIADYLLQIQEVQSRIMEKTSYLQSARVETLIPEEHNIRRWTTYLPALQKLDIEQVRNVTEDVLTQIRARPTTEGVDLLFSKIYQYALGIQSKIQRIIKKKASTALLKTSLNIPFVENACCIDHTPNSVIGYFEKEEPILKRYIEISTELTNIIYSVNRVYKASQIVSTINTKRIYPEIGNGITQETMYAAFVFQIKQDIINDIGRLPEDTEASSSAASSSEHTKKENVVKVFDTLQENIARLKDAGISYTKADFERLLKHRFAKGIVSPEEIYTPHKRTLIAITEELENMQVYIGENPENPPVLPMMFVRTFLSTIANEKQGLPNLKTYLNKENKRLLTEIKTFMRDARSPALKHIDGLMDNFVTPEIMVEMSTTFLENLTQVYPSIIVNKTKSQTTKLDIPKYWDISPQHAIDLTNVMLEKYKALEVFYETPDIVTLVQFMRDNTKSFMSLVKKMGMYYTDYASYKLQNPEQTVLDLAAVGLLFKYFFYIIYIQYVNLARTAECLRISPKIVGGMLDSFIELCLNQKAIVNKEMKDVADSVINIKNIEKNRMLDELGKLTSDEHQSNKVLKALKLKRWSVPKNLRAYTKSGYEKDAGIFDEDDAFQFSVEEEEGYDAEETGENDETFGYDLEENEEDLEADFDFDMDWRELVGEDGDAEVEDGDYANVDIDELNKE